MDFFFRKIIKDQAESLGLIAGQIQEVAKNAGTHGGALRPREGALGEGLDSVQGILGYGRRLMKSDPRAEGGDVATCTRSVRTPPVPPPPVTSSSAGSCSARPRSPSTPWPAT